MSQYLLLSDIHASDKAPSSCTDSYWPDLLDLLKQSVALARIRGVAAVVWAGDVFHNKAPNRTSHRLVQQLISVIDAYGCPVYIVPGNHDVRNDHLGSIYQTQPLGVLYQAGAILLEEWADGYPLYGVPWLGEWTDEYVYNALGHYRDADLPGLVVAHAPLYPPGKELPWQYYPAADWAKAMFGQGQCFYGHVHEPHGTWETGHVTFCNNGALSRGSLHEYNLTRDVGVTIWDSKTGEFDFIELSAKPASEVFRLTEKQQVTDMQGRLDEFLASVSHTNLQVLNVETAREYMLSMGLGKDVEDLITELLEQAAE